MKNFNNTEKELYLIYKGGYYYRPLSKGYTPNTHEAGVFSKDEAERHKAGCSDLILIKLTDELVGAYIEKEQEEIDKHKKNIEAMKKLQNTKK